MTTSSQPVPAMSDSIPSLYTWLGGIEAIGRLTTRFYERVPGNAKLAPIFAHMSSDHAKHVAAFLAEVLGGGEVKGPYVP